MNKDLYTIEEAAQILDVHAITIRRYIKDGKLKANKICGQWKIPDSAIKEILKETITEQSTTDNVDSFVSVDKFSEYKVSVCTIVNIKADSPEELIPLSTELMILLNSEDESRKWFKFEYIYLPDKKVGRFTLYSNPKYISKLLEVISKYE